MNAKTLIILILLAANEPLVTAGELTVPSSTVGGGGASSGGPFSVRGTVGETIPAVPTLTGGAFNVSAGFVSRVALIPTPGAPLLSISLTNGLTRISWPSASAGFQLQETSELHSAPAATPWANSSLTVNDNGTVKSVTIPNATGLKYFRLHKAP